MSVSMASNYKELYFIDEELKGWISYQIWNNNWDLLQLLRKELSIMEEIWLSEQ